MYASQAKRLCVRGASSDDTARVPQHHPTAPETEHSSVSNASSSSSTLIPPYTHNHQLDCESQVINQQYLAQQELQPTSIVGATMTASSTGMTGDDGKTSLSPAKGSLVASVIATQTTPSVANATTPFHNVQDHHSPNHTRPNLQNDDNALSDLVDKLASDETPAEIKLDLLLALRNLITACNKKKDLVVSHPQFIRIISLIDCKQLDKRANIKTSIQTQVALLLCSVAKSSDHSVELLKDIVRESSVDDKILSLVFSSQDRDLTEACLRALRALMSWPMVSRCWLLYENVTPISENTAKVNGTLIIRSNLQKLIAYAQDSDSYTVQECVADIFAATCVRNRDQTLLFKASAIPCIVSLIESSSIRVVIAALNWLTQICLKNQQTSLEIVKARCPSGLPVLDRLITMMDKDKFHELQFLSARCYVYIYRALSDDILKEDPRIVSHILPTLVRMVHKDKAAHLRIKSAESIAYLIECETKLQSIASVCDHLIESLADMLEYEHSAISIDLKSCAQTVYRCSRVQDRGVSWLSITSQQQATALEIQPCHFEPSKNDLTETTTTPSQVEPNQKMKRAAFLSLAALASNLELIRKKIFNTCSIMQHLVKSLTDTDTKTLKSALTCLLSLSRSVQQLRTSFAESSVYSALKSLLGTSSNEVLILVLAILCNISLDFSPGKQHFLDSKTIDILCNLTRRSDPVLRLHGVWILMNMVYQLKDQNLKFQILRSLGVNHLLSLLESKDDEEVVLKTLGFLRNLLSQKLHIDAIMSNHGEQVIQALIRILDTPCSNTIKEQCLCVFTNIADGSESKSFVMNNRVILAYLARTMCDEQAGDLRLAAICCITNLARKEYEGSFERREEMNKFGIEEKLKSMLNTNDPILSGSVRTAYNQFMIGGDDKYVN